MELLSPAGAWESLVAAVQNGADAVYLGAQALNARMGAGNFDADALCRASDYLHERGKKLYVTVNILVKPQELGVLEEVASQLARAGADAAIVQDLGVCRALSKLLPSLALHASTQMALHNAQGVRFAKRIGLKRVVLARELRFEEIEVCAREGLEIEVFAHGALCSACSGQCLFSSLVGGRSGNRGQCAQPCRLPYRLEGAVGAQGYLLSTRDLMTLGDLADYRRAGVASLKIEGRLKRPEYVALVTRAYREALDRLETYGEAPLDEIAARELAQVFNRGGFTHGCAPGLVDREYTFPERPNHAGVAIGRAVRNGVLALSETPNDGDALALRGRKGDIPVRAAALSPLAAKEIRTISESLRQASSARSVRVGTNPRSPAPAKDANRFSESNRQTLDASQRSSESNAQNCVRCAQAEVGDTLIRLTDEALMKRARESYNGEHARAFVSARLSARVGEPLALSVTDGQRQAEARGEPVELAKGGRFDAERARRQLEKTGSVPYELLDLALDADENAFVSSAALNELRRRALEALSQARIREARGCESALRPLPDPALRFAPPREKPLLRVQSASLSLLERALALGADEAVYCPDDVTERGLERAPAFPFALAVPPVLCARDLDALNEYAKRHAPSRVLLANAGALALKWPCEMQADFLMNAANPQALALLAELGVTSFTPSLELTAKEIRALFPNGAGCELLVYGRAPLMQLRHCPMRAQTAGAHETCRRCDADARTETLIDRTGARFPLARRKTSSGCVLELLNSVPLNLLRHALPASDGWRMLLYEESELPAVSAHRCALDGVGLDENALGSSTTGHYFRGVE